ncbi:MAG: pentapeptide repeat-containing protein [Alphaproteobacteria bacterium]|jgi:uncharacterized integral membrane protein|nr:pentapeptide repeat-containing protein [Alphaproteobacteria bacterium]
MLKRIIDYIDSKIIYTLLFMLIVFICMAILYATEWFEWETELVNYLINGKDNSKYATLTAIGAVIVGLVAIITLILSTKRFNQTQEQIRKTEEQHKETLEKTQKQITLAEENNLNTTFKDAIILLGNENVSVRIGGVYTLIDIARKNQKTHAERINSILCKYIVEETNKPNNIRQSKELIRLILIKNSDTFKEYTKDLSHVVIKDIDFIEVNLTNYKFFNSILDNCKFSKDTLTKCNFFQAKLTRVRFDSSNLDKCMFDGTTLTNCNFNNSKLGIILVDEHKKEEIEKMFELDKAIYESKYIFYNYEEYQKQKYLNNDK